MNKPEVRSMTAPGFVMMQCGYNGEQVPEVTDGRSDRLFYRSEVEHLRDFLNQYLAAFPDDREIAHLNQDNCGVEGCQLCLERELKNRFKYFAGSLEMNKLNTPHKGEVALIEIGSIHKVVASKNMDKRLPQLERECGESVRCLGRIQTNHINKLKYYWMILFGYFSVGDRNFLLPLSAIAFFTAKQNIILEADAGIYVPEEFQPQTFGISIRDLPVMRDDYWSQPDLQYVRWMRSQDFI